MKFYFSKKQAIYIADIINRYIQQSDGECSPLARELEDYLRNGGTEV